MSEMNKSFDFAAALRGETLASSSSFDFAKTLRSNIPEADDGNLAERFGQGVTGNSDLPWLEDESDDSRVRPDDELDLRQQRILNPRLAWNQYSETARSIDLSDWSKVLQNGGSIEDWQRQAMVDAGVIVDSEEEKQASPSSEEEQVADESVKKSIREKMGEFLQNYDWGRLARDGFHVLVPFLTGGALTTILSPEQAHNLIVTAFGVGGVGFLTASACATVEAMIPRHQRAGKLARSLAFLSVTGAVFAETGLLMGAGASAGVALHAREALGSMMKSTSGGAVKETPQTNVVPEASDQKSQTEIAPPQSPDAQAANREAVDNAAKLEQAKAETQLRAAELERNRLAMEEVLRQQQQAVAEASRIAVLNQGQTVADLAKTMPHQTVSEAVHQIVGNGPHSLEITNVIDRAASDDVLRLHEGAIKEMAKVLSEQFAKADAAAAGMGVPYNQGGLQAAEQMYGANSPVVHAIRAANLENQMESAGVVREFLRPILSGLGAK